MASKVEICNVGLSAVGVTVGIASMDEASTEAQECSKIFDLCRDQVLRDFNWDFARRFVTLNLVAESPNSEWTYSYRYPSDCLKVRRIVSGNRREARRIPFQLGSDSQGMLIYTDAAEAVVEQTTRIEDTALYPADVAFALGYLIGYRVAKPLARDSKEQAAARQAYLIEISNARANAGNETGTDELPEAESIRARD